MDIRRNPYTVGSSLHIGGGVVVVVVVVVFVVAVAALVVAVNCQTLSLLLLECGCWAALTVLRTCPSRPTSCAPCLRRARPSRIALKPVLSLPEQCHDHTTSS